MGQIILSNIRIYAHHGCLPEERIIGSEYRVDLRAKADLNPSAKSDDLTDTVDYVLLNHIVKTEMAKPANLLENVAQRILERIFQEAKRVKTATVWVRKINPPIGGDVAHVSVRISQKRKK